MVVLVVEVVALVVGAAATAAAAVSVVVVSSIIHVFVYMCVNGLPYCGGCRAGKWSMRPKVITLIRKLIVACKSGMEHLSSQLRTLLLKGWRNYGDLGHSTFNVLDGQMLVVHWHELPSY